MKTLKGLCVSIVLWASAIGIAEWLETDTTATLFIGWLAGSINMISWGIIDGHVVEQTEKP